MEMLDIVDEYGEPTGRVKERSQVHKDGDRHRTSHVWIVRDNDKGSFDILLQKRSENKDSFPGCLDISSAGHIVAGTGFLESALRELKEELGITASKDQFIECGMRTIVSENIFHDKLFKDNQITKVYKLKLNDLDINTLNLQKEEVESVVWIDFNQCIEGVKNNTINHCIYLEELLMLKD